MGTRNRNCWFYISNFYNTSPNLRSLQQIESKENSADCEKNKTIQLSLFQNSINFSEESGVKQPIWNKIKFRENGRTRNPKAVGASVTITIVTFNQTIQRSCALGEIKRGDVVPNNLGIHTVKTVGSHPILHSIYDHENCFLRDDPPLPLAVKRWPNPVYLIWVPDFSLLYQFVRIMSNVKAQGHFVIISCPDNGTFW